MTFSFGEHFFDTDTVPSVSVSLYPISPTYLAEMIKPKNEEINKYTQGQRKISYSGFLLGQIQRSFLYFVVNMVFPGYFINLKVALKLSKESRP